MSSFLESLLYFCQLCLDLRHRSAVDVGAGEFILVIFKTDKVLLIHIGELGDPLLEDPLLPFFFLGLYDQLQPGVNVSL